MAAVITEILNGTAQTFTYDPSSFGSNDVVIFLDSDGGVALGGDVEVVFTTQPVIGSTIRYYWGSSITVGSYGFVLNGQAIPSTFVEVAAGYIETHLSNAGIDYVNKFYSVPLNNNDTFDGDILLDGSVALTKLVNLTSAHLIVGSASNIPTSVAVTGDVTISNAGVTAIGSGVIVNADINASAAIAVSKLAALTASKALVTDVSGVITTANQLSPALGGTGQDLSASTGFVKVSAGTVSAGSISEIITLQVSFESGYAGDFKILMPYAGTVTGIYAYAIKAIAGTDNGTIVAKNNGGTTMTSGTVTFTASDARGTAYSVSPSANNTFADGDLLTFTTAKTTAGGVVQLSITVTRTS